MCETIAISNLKGETGKSVTTANLSIGLARQGQRVLLSDKRPITLSTIIESIINDSSELLFKTISQLRRNINPQLAIGGILLTYESLVQGVLDVA